MSGQRMVWLVLAIVALMGCEDAERRRQSTEQPTAHPQFSKVGQRASATPLATAPTPKKSLVDIILEDRLTQARGRISSNPAEVRALSKLGITPLQAACVRNHLGLVKLLVERGADVNSMGEGYYAPLHTAARRGYPKLVAYLLSKGAKVDLPNRHYKRTPLWYAAEQGRVGIVRRLLRAGANPHRKDDRGVSPLAQARVEAQEQRQLNPGAVMALAKRVKPKAQKAVTSLLTMDYPAVVRLLENAPRPKGG